MSSSALRNLVYAQLSFFSFLLGAAVINREGFVDNNGLSYYGEHADTIVPYGLGLLCCAVFVWRAAAGLSGLLAPHCACSRHYSCSASPPRTPSTASSTGRT